LIALLARHGYLGEARATMAMLGVDVGLARLRRNKRARCAANLSCSSSLIRFAFDSWPLT
jgi:hypothetical protein